MKLTLIFAAVITLLSCSTGPKLIGVTEKKTEMQHIKVLNLLQTEYTFKVGEECKYVSTIHGSVGIQEDVAVTGDDILGTESVDFKYNKAYPEGERRPSGGDAAKRTYVFKALKVGEAQITIDKVYRGTTESTHVLTLKVVE